MELREGVAVKQLCRTFVSLTSMLLLCNLVSSLPAFSAEPSDYPVFATTVPDLNSYRLFANSGWDGNWFVGYGSCWIKKLPPIRPGRYARAFLGAKLGRAKMDGPSLRTKTPFPVPGSIYMSLSSVAAWTPAQDYLLATTDQLPLDGDAEVPLQSGESQWFWTEVPISAVNLTGDNYVALWSPSSTLVNSSSSPILAAAWGGKDSQTWLARDTHGEPPRQARPNLGDAISVFHPAIMLKLIPAADPSPLSIRLVSWQDAPDVHLNPVMTVDVTGRSPERVWMEYASGKGGDLQWKKFGRMIWTAPYILSVDRTQLPPGRVKIRAVAANVWEQVAATTPVTVEVSNRATH